MTTTGRVGAGQTTGSRVTRRHLRNLLLAIAAAAVVGSIGFALLPGWTIGDAVYQTVMTLSTVGYREVHELEGIGRAWAMIVMVAGIGIIFSSIAIATEFIVGEVASGRREARAMQRWVDETSDHFILCGYGRVGSTVARELAHAGNRLVVIDTNDASRAQAQADGFPVVEGDATTDATLEAAGIRRARGLVSTVDTDAQNVFVVLSARALNPGLFIVGRANFESTAAKLTAAGANRVVSPYTLAGRRIAELAVRPRVADYIDAALSHGDMSFSMEEVEVATGSWLDGRTVGELRAGGVATLAIFRGEQRGKVNPEDDHRLVAGESIVVSGPADALVELRRRA